MRSARTVPVRLNSQTAMHSLFRVTKPKSNQKAAPNASAFFVEDCLFFRRGAQFTRYSNRRAKRKDFWPWQCQVLRMDLRAGDQRWTFPRPALVMGVVNVTPDSFSDGGAFPDAKAAIAHGLRLMAEGADMLDVGGESTRPGAVPVDEAEELQRVIPVVEGLAGRIPISVDTMKPTVARAALEAGAVIVNDVMANRSDPEMWEVVAKAKAGYVLMHMQGTPRTMQDRPHYKNVVNEVNEFFDERLKRLNAFGIAVDQVILDVGIGFGKTVEHNLQLLASLNTFTRWKRPILLGASRKGFIGRLTGAESPRDRLPGSLACACWGVAAGASIVRTHDVAATRAAIRMTESIGQWTERND